MKPVKTLKTLLPSLVVIALSSCAMLNSARNGDVSGVVHNAANSAGDVKAIADKQEKCNDLGKAQVTIEEEYQIGGAIALGLASNTAGVYVEISPDLKNAKPTPNVKPKPGTGEKTDLTKYVNELGKSLAAFSSRPDIDWTFIVLDSDTPNAFSAPGGYVFVTTGMLKLVENEAQLAGILAHEIGHVSGRHALEAYKKGKVSSCKAAVAIGAAANAAKDSVSLLGDFDRIMGAANIDLSKASADLIVKFTDATVGELASKGVGRDFELAADKTAFDIMVFGGYDVREFDKVLGKIPDGGVFANHPSGKDRIANLANVKKTDYADFSFDALKSPDNSAALKTVKK